MQWLAHLALVAYLTQSLIGSTDLPTCATLHGEHFRGQGKLRAFRLTHAVAEASPHLQLRNLFLANVVPHPIMEETAAVVLFTPLERDQGQEFEQGVNSPPSPILMDIATVVPYHSTGPRSRTTRTDAQFASRAHLRSWAVSLCQRSWAKSVNWLLWLRKSCRCFDCFHKSASKVLRNES